MREWAKDSPDFARETIIGTVGRAGKMVGASAMPRRLDDPCPTSSMRPAATKSRRPDTGSRTGRNTTRPWYGGSITVWLTEEAVEAWHAPATGERGGQPVYSAIAIETGLALRLVFHQPLRQTEGLLRSIADVLGVDIRVPDHTTLSRRGGGLTVLLKRIGQ